ncbi:MAG: 5'-methylthioadenosine/adenosylhomocysteine nucleosidase [Clostridiales bacterium]|nr:5'-methylthioadenosine/adenosylhomocysteine nucleosidase [Clostridiales bacterium]
MIGIISAMDVEIESLINQLTHCVQTEISSLCFYEGKLHSQRVVLAVCGVGKVNAAICTQTMILHFSPKRIINLGVAGSLDPKVNIGHIVIGENCVQYDFDTTSLGEPLGLIPKVNQVYIPCDPSLISELEKAVLSLKNTSYHIGTIATADQFVTEGRKDILAHFPALCCEMEGGAIAQVCYLNQVPFAVVRAISDNANAEATIDFPTFTKMAADVSTAFMTHFLSQ